MGPFATTLAAISAGAVFMGANTYIGNAPNFMVKAIAEHRGVRMPNFFAFFGWALLVLGPIYAILVVLFSLVKASEAVGGSLQSELRGNAGPPPQECGGTVVFVGSIGGH